MNSDPAPSPEPHGYADRKPDLLARLHRAEGQVRGVTRMVTEGRSCIDVPTQISAVRHALQEVALGLVDDHVRHCVTGAVRSHPACGEEKFGDISAALHRAPRR